MEDDSIPEYWKYLDTPPDSTVIWRYRSFPQLLSLLEYGTLWFSRIDQFKDPYEGSVTEHDAETRIQTHEALSESNYDEERLKKAGENWRKSLYANCWHERAIESASFWEIYSRRGQAVAIKSTVGSVLDSISIGGGPDSDGHVGGIEWGRVEYIDFETDRIGHNPLVRPFFKRESFKHEEEVRFILHYTHVDETPEEENIVTPDFSSQPPGIRLHVILDRLINEIRISPWADDWFVDLVKDVAETFGVEEVYASNLAGEPRILL